MDRLLELGIETISSQALADRFNLNSAQIRKDLAYFGEFGVRGVGYNVRELRQYVDRDPRSGSGTPARHRRRREPRHRPVSLLRVLRRQFPGRRDPRFRPELESATRPRPVSWSKTRPAWAKSSPRRRVEIGVITTPASAAQSVSEQHGRRGSQGDPQFRADQRARRRRRRWSRPSISVFTSRS